MSWPRTASTAESRRGHAYCKARLIIAGVGAVPGELYVVSVSSRKVIHGHGNRESLEYQYQSGCTRSEDRSDFG